MVLTTSSRHTIEKFRSMFAMRGLLELLVPTMPAFLPVLNSRISSRGMVSNMLHQHHTTAGPKWLPGCIRAVLGPLSYDVELGDGKIVKKHIDHVRSRASALSTGESSSSYLDDLPLPLQSGPMNKWTFQVQSQTTMQLQLKVYRYSWTPRPIEQ